ncbi:ABC transporter ATP-binding protein [Roseivirga sp. BDSF3-8]|uniref:ABC transporter ATP-binding protein n=1 Tax=Roseivirga sp. BDSF3-8 TaxID=3241598 RepID=UPI003531C98B
MREVVHVENITVGYPPKAPLLEAVNLSVTEGNIACIAGRNGTGKSTLMRTLAGMQKPLAGQVTVQGKRLNDMSPRELARKLAIVTTERIAAGHLRVHELVALGRYPFTGPFGRLTSHDRAVVEKVMQITGCDDLGGHFTYTLSDGQWQRVMIARALAQEPAILLLDEPTSFLDWPGKAGTFTMLRKLAMETGLAVIYASHDLEMALPVADRLWLLHNGRITTGLPEDMLLSGILERAFDLPEGTLVHGHYPVNDTKGLEVRGPDHLKRLLVQALRRQGENLPATTGIIEAGKKDGHLSLVLESSCFGRETFTSINSLLSFLKNSG